MILKDFINYLNKLPPETVVHVLRLTDAGYNGYDADFEELKIEENTDFTDLRGNKFAEGKPWENDIDLYLGEK